MRTEASGSSEQPCLKSRTEVWCLAVLAVLLIALAAPLALREAMLLPHGATVQGLTEGKPLPTEDVEGLKQTLRRLSVLPPSARGDLLAARVARRQFDTVAMTASLKAAATLAPGHGPIWTGLAYALPPGTEAARALRLSALTSLFEFDATPRRVDLGLRLWPYMNTEDRDAFGRLVLALWDWQPGRLAMIAARYDAYDQVAPYLQAARPDWTILPGSYAIHRLTPQVPYPYAQP